MFDKLSKEEKIRKNIDGCIRILLEKLPEIKWRNRHYIRPYFVAFDIPETENEAFLRMDGMGDEEVKFRVDVVKKGTSRAYSHYLQGCSHNEVENYLCNVIEREEIYNSVIHLSEKVDEYWDEH